MLSKSSPFKTSYLIIFFIFIICGEIFSQNIEGVNARLDAMGGSAAADDIGWTIGHPASIYKFPNTFQGSVCLLPIPGIDRTYGAVIGIVRFNDFLYAGITYNDRRSMSGSFYRDAYILHLLNISGEPWPDPFPHIPQVNLCLKLNDNIKFGVGGYFEGFTWEYKAVKKLPYDTSGTGLMDTINYNEDHDKKSVKNNGFNIEAKITVGGLTIYPQILIGFPRIRGTESYNTLSKAKTQLASSNASDSASYSDLTLIYDSEQKLRLRAGSYFWGNIGNTFCKTGVIYENMRHQFNKRTDRLTQQLNTNGTVMNTLVDTLYDSIPSDHNYNFIHAFLCFVPSFSDNLFFSPEYNGGIGWYKGKDDISSITDVSYDPSDTTFLFTYHNIRLGIEKVKESFLFFDEIAFRCGIQAQWNKEWRYIDELDATTSVSEESIPWKSFFWGYDYSEYGKQAIVSGGFGLKKGRGSFDASCDWIRWDGESILTGPQAAMATLTVDFSRKKDF